MSDPTTINPITLKLAELRAAHRALDARIEQIMTEGGYVNMLEVQRLKRQKLAIKDKITHLESERYPDIIA